MMNMKKKMISLLLVLALVVGICPAAFAGEGESHRNTALESNTVVHIVTDKMSVDGQLSCDNESAAVKTNAEGNENRFVCDLELEDKNAEETVCTAKGTLTVVGEVYDFAASGNLVKVEARNGDVVYIGSLTGNVDGKFDPVSMIALTIHYNETTKETFVPVCLGSYGADGGAPIEVEFGYAFSSLNSAAKAYIEKRNIREKKTTRTVSGKPYTTNVEDDLVCLTTQTGSYQGYQVIFGSAYGVNVAPRAGSWLIRNRAQVNMDNFKKGHAKTLVAPGTTETGVILAEDYKLETVWLNFSASNKNCLVSGEYPDAFSRSIAISKIITLPYGFLNKTISLFDLQIPLKSVSHIRSNEGSSLQTKIANSGGMPKATTTSTNPYGEQTGVGNKFMVYNPVVAGGTVTGKTNVSAEITFIATRQNGVSYLDSVIISSSQTQFTLRSGS